MRPALRPLLVLASALLVLVALTVAAAGQPSDQGNPSSRSPGRLGTLAMYTWMDRLGLPVHRITSNFDLSSTDLLVVYDPLNGYTPSDVDTTMSYLRGGGDIVLAMDNTGSVDAVAPLLTRLQIGIQDPTPGGGNATVAQPFDSSDRVHSVPVGPGFSFGNATPLVPLLKQGTAVIAAAVRAGGGGRVYVIGSTLPLSNDGLRHDDAEWFVLSLLERSRGGHVAFDEFHHGEGGPAATGAGAIFNGPIGIAAGLTVAVAVLFLAVSGRRLGRPAVGTAPVPVPSATAYVTAMAQLFTRSRRLGAIAERYGDELKRSIGALTGIESHLDDASFVAAVSAAGDDRAPALAALLNRARALATGQPDEPALLRLARDVDGFERSWAAGSAV